MALAWDKVALLLCCFGFLKEFRPSESFVTQYLLGPDKNFTKSQVNQEIYPVGTYSNLSLLVAVFLITDWVRYKPMIVIEGISGVFVYVLLIWGQDVPAMQAVEFFYGLFMAADVAYKTYMYAMCDKKQYQKVSAYVQAAVLLGRFVSGIVSQLTISFNLLSYHQLNFLTLSGVILSVPFAVLLPSVQGSLYFHSSSLLRQRSNTAIERGSSNEVDDVIASSPNETPSLAGDNIENVIIASSPNQTSFAAADDLEDVPLRGQPTNSHEVALKDRRVGVAGAILEDFCSAYSNKNVVIWSFWWSLGTCGYLQVTSYIQMLWQVTVEDENEELLNGAIDASYTILGALLLWFIGRQKVNLEPFSSVIIILCCITEGILLLICSYSSLLWVQYSLYVLYKVLYHSIMVFASAEVAKSLSRDSHALVFGFNTFVALFLQTILTFVVAGKGGFRLKIRDQFLVYGCYFILIGIGFCISVCIPAMKLFVHFISSSKSHRVKQSFPNEGNAV